MSSGVAPVPSANAALVADRQPHRDPSHDDGRGETVAAPSKQPDAPESGNVVPLNAEATIPDKGAAFAASQLVERLRLVEANLRLLKLKSEGWKPPASDLALRDKTI